MLRANVADNLITTMFYFYTPKASESQSFSDIFNVYRRDNNLKWLKTAIYYFW